MSHSSVHFFGAALDGFLLALAVSKACKRGGNGRERIMRDRAASLLLEWRAAKRANRAEIAALGLPALE